MNEQEVPEGSGGSPGTGPAYAYAQMAFSTSRISGSVLPCDCWGVARDGNDEATAS